MKKSIIIASSVIIIAILLCVVVVIRVIYPLLAVTGFPPMSQNRIRKDFLKNQELILIVTDYLVSSEYNDICIRDTMKIGEMSIDGEHVGIEDYKVITAIDTLEKEGYHVITKRGTTISFQRWRNLAKCRGIAYSIDGGEPDLDFPTKIESLPEGNWYYYEEDFHEWKIRNK